MKWQCVFLCWGNKYSSSDITDLVRNVSKNATVQPKFKLITDQFKHDLPSIVDQILLPPFYNNDLFLGGGCQAKLSMFESGVLEKDTLAIYLDLDTAVWGDLSRLGDRIKNKTEIHMLKASLFSSNICWRFISKLTNKKVYLKGNSSILAFYPCQNTDISKAFSTLFGKRGAMHNFKPMIADDRFISWYAQGRYKTIPTTFAVKFRNEFMGRSKFLLRLKVLCPWIEERRQRLSVMTFPGLSCKPSELLLMKDNQKLLDHRKRKLVWSTKYMGRTKAKIEKYYSEQQKA